MIKIPLDDINEISPTRTISNQEEEWPKLLSIYDLCLSNCNRFDFSIAYFSSSWIKILAHGFAKFTLNEGFSRWIISPIFQQNEQLIKAQQKVDESHIMSMVLNDAEKLMNDLRNDPELINILAWLIESEKLKIKVATGTRTEDMHEKETIFFDDLGGKFVISSTANATEHGFLSQRNRTTLISSSKEPDEVDIYIDDFERNWKGEGKKIINYDLSQAIKDKIISYRTNEKKGYIPYESIDKVLSDKKNQSHSINLIESNQVEVPADITLRDYQITAYDEWKSNSYSGILEMATGTGKTITAVSMITKLINENKKRIIVLNICPFIHLVDQFSEDAIRFGFKVIKIYGSKNDWWKNLNDNLRFENKNKLFISVTNKTFISETFQDIIKDYLEEMVLVIDEVHYASSDQMIINLPRQIKYRLGLSATPESENDDEKNDKLLSYFNGILKKSIITLEDAIKEGYLTPYNYYPVFLEMDKKSYKKYSELSLKIKKLSIVHKNNFNKIFPIIKKRIDLINKLPSKLSWLEEYLKNKESIEYTIFYCGEGEFFKKAFEIFSSSRHKLFAKFTHQETASDKERILRNFSLGQINSLLAIKCLDEGVNIPKTKNAVFLASSTTNREFIQRRGRVLRTHKDKDFANIIDIFVLPPGESAIDMDEEIAKIIQKERKRFDIFANLAINKNEAKKELSERFRGFFKY
ncbi:DEAD/DEAH box helicase family protein [bacterium]|nr:DEAD/DEAH box helicase family protein [bacterium]